MKLTIAWRLALVLMLVGLLGTGLTGYFAYQTSREQLVKASEDRLLTATRVLMRQVIVALKDIAADVSLVAQHPQAARILQHTNSGFQALSEDNVSIIFERLMTVHPEYFQIRLIEAANYGRERIRVDRGLSGLLRIKGDDLQEKGHYNYVFDTLPLASGAVYVSRATINHEVGAHAGVGKPSLQVAAPIHDLNGKAVGVVVINVDLQGLFAQLASDLPPELKLYLTNGNGDFLIHPDSARSFAFDRGQSALVQDEFPAASSLLQGSQPRHDNVVIQSKHTTGAADALVAAFVFQPLSGLEAEDEFILGLSQPLASVLADSNQHAADIMRIVLSLSVLAIFLAIILARYLTQPLRDLVAEVRRFSTDGTIGASPGVRADEIGELARSIEHMEVQIHNQFEVLQNQKVKLEHLANHDSLTGLPNRRLLLERLEQALERAKRNKTEVALLFIDLNRFKSINDTYGHKAGDAVLLEVAQRLHKLLRASDTAARIGGDEFLILIEGNCEAAAMDSIVSKVQAVLALSIPHQDIELRCGGSIGVARYPQDGATAATLIAVADQSMYQSKARRDD